MQSNRTKPSRAAGVGTTISLLLLGTLLTLAALYFCLKLLQPSIEADLTDRATDSLASAGITGAMVSVEGQDATLTGRVADAATQINAGQITSEVYGIARVFNKLEVQGNTNTQTDEAEPGSTLTATEAALMNADSAMQEIPESTQKTATKPELVLENTAPVSTDVTETFLSPSTLDISVEDGRATMRGIVPDDESVDRISAALAGKYGFVNVKEDMSTFAGSAKPEWLDSAIELIDQLDDINNPALKITQDSALITGRVSSETLGNQKSALFRRLLGEYLEVSTNLTLIESSGKLPAPEAKPRTLNKRPASLKIRSIGGDLKLTGTVSTTEEAASIRNHLKNTFSGDVSDQLTIDDSVAEAEWLKEALSVTETVKTIDNFSVSINSGQLLLSGDVDDRLMGRTIASAVAEITGRKLNVVNNFTNTDKLIELSGEDLLAQALADDLDALNTAAIVFDSGRTTLTAEAKQVLDQVARVILSYKDQIIEVAGHTDSSGDALANLELSKKRAISVRNYLIERQVPSSRLRPIGYGETIPVADNTTLEGQAANRRIEFNLESR